jgi:hypothetical protein
MTTSVSPVSQKDFCRALQDDDRALLRAILDPVLQADGRQDKDESIRRLKSWLEAQACVASVEISPDLLDSEPPIQELIVMMKPVAGASAETKSIGIRLDPKQLSVNYKL